MRTSLACLILTLMTLGTACSQSADDHGLGSARTHWMNQLPSSYSFTWTQSCYCIPDMTRPIRITVASGQITSAVFADDQQAVGDPVRRNLQTIDGVFDKIQAALDQGADEVTVDFDPTRGYPRSVFVDYSRQAADEELLLQISDFTVNAG